MTDPVQLDAVVARLSSRHPDLPPGRVIRCVLRCRRELRATHKVPFSWPDVEQLAETRLTELHQHAS